MVSHVPRHHKSKLTIPDFTATITDIAHDTTIRLQFPTKIAKVRSKKPGQVHTVKYQAELMPPAETVNVVSDVSVTTTKTSTIRRVKEFIFPTTQVAGMASRALDTLERREQSTFTSKSGHGQKTYHADYKTDSFGGRTFTLYQPEATLNYEHPHDGMNRPAYLLQPSPAIQTVTEIIAPFDGIVSGLHAMAGAQDCDCPTGSHCMTNTAEPTIPATTFATLGKSHKDTVVSDETFLTSDNNISKPRPTKTLLLGPKPKSTTTKVPLMSLPPPDFPPVVVSASAADIEDASSA